MRELMVALGKQPIDKHGKWLLQLYLAGMRSKEAISHFPDLMRTCQASITGFASYHIARTISIKENSNNSRKVQQADSSINFHINNGNSAPRDLPKDSDLTAVPMQAMTEQVNPGRLAGIFKEIHPLLFATGMLVVTILSAWPGIILRYLARLIVVSNGLIGEHIFVRPMPLLMVFGLSWIRYE